MAASKTNNRTVACWVGAGPKAISVKPKIDGELNFPLFVNFHDDHRKTILTVLAKEFNAERGEQVATNNVEIDLPISWLTTTVISGKNGSAHAGSDIYVLDLREHWVAFTERLVVSRRGASPEAHQSASAALLARIGLATTTVADDDIL